MKGFWLLWGGLWLLFSPFDQARAIVFFSQGNDVNLTDPGNGLPWENVVQMRSDSGPIGTGVYLGNRYVLTAGHVGPLTSVKVGFLDYQLESSTTISIGTADMKLVRLASDPGLGNVNLNTSAVSDFGSVHLVGYGVGRAPDSQLNTSPVTWGDSSTAIKRWGTNDVDGFYSGVQIAGYTSDLVWTQFNRNVGSNEAALTIYDSGSALFRQIGSEWYLVGLGAYVQNSGYSLASDESNPNDSSDNYFIRISSYSNAADVIGGVGVPEPSSQSLLFVGVAFLSACLLARRSVGRRS